jgi:hypothetical protein
MKLIHIPQLFKDPGKVIFFFAAEEGKYNTEGSLTSINTNYIKKGHLILIGLIRTVQEKHLRV